MLENSQRFMHSSPPLRLLVSYPQNEATQTFHLKFKPLKQCEVALRSHEESNNGGLTEIQMHLLLQLKISYLQNKTTDPSRFFSASRQYIIA